MRLTYWREPGVVRFCSAFPPSSPSLIRDDVITITLAPLNSVSQRSCPVFRVVTLYIWVWLVLVVSVGLVFVQRPVP